MVKVKIFFLGLLMVIMMLTEWIMTTIVELVTVIGKNVKDLTVAVITKYDECTK